MKRRLFQGLGALVLLVVAIGIAAPFFNEDRYHDPVQDSLSAALGRPVTIGKVRLDLFTGPGLSVSDVTIADLPSNSAEPFAYVGELRAVPRLWSFWTGRLEFSSLTLVDAHVNLMRAERPGGSADWNFESLLHPSLLESFPTIRLRDARINFKIGNRKSTFYLLNTDLEVSPRTRDGSVWDVQVDGEPARTDRPANGFGEIAAKGRWTQSGSVPARLELDVKLDRSEIGDLVELVEGRAAGVQGIIAGQAHMAGPLSGIGVEGELRVSELHGWGQSPSSGRLPPFHLSGTIGADRQHVELFGSSRTGDAGVAAKLTADQVLQAPRISFDAQLRALPVASFPGLLRDFGATLPSGLRLSGALAGDIRYDSEAGWRGTAQVEDASINLENVPPLHLGAASLDVDQGAAHLAPVSMTSGDQPIGSVGGGYSLSDGSFEVDLASDGGPIAGLLQAFPIAATPLLARMQSAHWSGQLRYVQPVEGPGQWTGAGDLSDAVAMIPELGAPLSIVAAHLSIDGDRIDVEKMDLRSEGISAGGDYSYIPGAPRPHQFHLTLGDADALALERLFQPVVGRRANLLDLALGRAAPPDWLRSLHAEGSIQAASLRLGDVNLERVRSKVQWDGTQILFSGWQSAWESAAVGGRILVDAREATPRFDAALKLKAVPWQSGRVDGAVRLQSSGLGLDALRNLRADGRFVGSELALQPFGMIEQATGLGEIAWTPGGPRVRFSELQLTSSGEKWTGSGESHADGGVLLQLTNNGRQINLAGSFTSPAKEWVEQ